MSAAEFKNAGNQFLQSGEFDKAIEAYTQAIALDGSDHVFYSNRSAAYLSKGDGVNALNDAEKCVVLSPQWAKGYTRKGAALHSLKRYDDAVEAYEAGLVIAPSDSGLKNGIDEVRKAKAASSSSRGRGGASNLKNQLIAKLATHPKFGPKLADPTFMAKLGLLESSPDLMLKDPEMMEAFSVLLGGDGGMFGGAGNDAFDDSAMDTTPPPAAAPAPSKATPKYSESSSNETPEERAVRTKKEQAVAAKERGNALYKSRQFEEALAAYDEAIALDPTNILFVSNKASVYIEMGDTETAIRLCTDAIDVGRSNKATYADIAKVYQRMASAALKADDLQAALGYFGKAQMEDFDKNIERKIKNLELEAKKKAAAAYIDPELGLQAKERGNTAFRDGDFATAIKEYEDAVKRDPRNAPYHNNLAAALLKVGNFNGAKAEVEKSLDIDPKYVKAWAKKGDIEFFMKEYHKAMDSYRKGLQIEPDNSLCKQGLQKTASKVNEGGEMDTERQAHAMADPEIQAILQDPMVRQVLTDLQENPKYGQSALNDPIMRAKIEKLIASGVLQVK